MTNAQGTFPILRAEGLTKWFPGVRALDDVGLELAAGEVHALVGQNGAGKSTLINILSGMYPADGGTVSIDGAPVALRSSGHAIRLGIATVYQELSVLPNLTVAENLALGREPRRLGLLDRIAMRRMAVGVVERLGLAIAPDARVGTLSIAERQMVEIAKALATNPRILILDEPTAPLGAREVDQLVAAIRRLRQEGVAILYVSHRFTEVLSLCDGATVLRNGRNVVTTPLAGWSEARLTDTMLGVQAQLYERTGRPAGDVFLEATGLRAGHRVADVGFTVRRGEILAMTGLLGAGQSEIARLLGGDIEAEAGTITVVGQRVYLRSPSDAVTAGICLLTDDRKQEGLLPNLPLRENIAVASLGARRGFLGSVQRPAEDRAVAKAAREFGVVAATLEVPVRTLSGGNQQKSLLARWHLADADLFVLIEPTRGVDVGARAEIYRRLDALARAGKAIVIVSSDIAEVLAVADRILVLRNGRISAETFPHSVDEEALNLLVQGVERAA